MPDILSKIASSATADDEINRLQKFAQENNLISNKIVKTALENAKLNLKWSSQHVPVIVETIKTLL